jgi:hypothetical protein
MGKKLLISLIVLLVLSMGISSYFLLRGNEKIDVLMMTHDDLYNHALKQTEVQNQLGNQEIENWEGSPASATFTDNPYEWVSYPDIYTVIKDNKPSCLNVLKKGDLVRTIIFHTSSKSVWVIYSLDANDIKCVLSYPKDKYKD